MNNKDFIFEEVSKLGNKLIVKEYPTKQGTMQMIRAHIEKQKRMGWHPDLIVVDYADLLKFTTRYSEMRHDLQGVTEELRGLGKEFNAGVWTASQSNREGYKTSSTGLEHLSEAFSKSFCTDLAIVIGRTPKEKANNTAIYNIGKNRNGMDGVKFLGKMDTSAVQVSFDSILDEDYDIQQRKYNEQSEADAKNAIARKYYSDNFLPED
jgi:replicative DNA helicase